MSTVLAALHSQLLGESIEAEIALMQHVALHSEEDIEAAIAKFASTTIEAGRPIPYSSLSACVPRLEHGRGHLLLGLARLVDDSTVPPELRSVQDVRVLEWLTRAHHASEGPCAPCTGQCSHQD